MAVEYFKNSLIIREFCDCFSINQRINLASVVCCTRYAVFFNISEWLSNHSLKIEPLRNKNLFLSSKNIFSQVGAFLENILQVRQLFHN